MIAQIFPYMHLRRRYDCYPPTAFLLATLTALAWVFLRLESPAWQTLLEQRQRWYPHVANKAPSAGDPLRIALQSLWLLVARPLPERRRRSKPQWVQSLGQSNLRLWERAARFLNGLPQQTKDSETLHAGKKWWQTLSPRQQHWLNYSCAAVGLVLVVVCITEPFGYGSQLMFVFLLWAVAMVVRRVPGRFPTLLLIVLSIIVSCRYLWWRYTATLNWAAPMDLAFGVLLLIAETYSWLVLLLGYIQTCWPLQRLPAQLPADTRLWPTVDLLIPTYNEDLSMVRATVFAALAIDWPHDKLRISILDDGRREEFREFAAEAGVGYITRRDNKHAKAGNLNHALTQARRRVHRHLRLRPRAHPLLPAADHGLVPARPEAGMLQTPHHFFSPDPFERNLGTFRQRAQRGRAVLRPGAGRQRLVERHLLLRLLRGAAPLGARRHRRLAVETVTEDAHTSLRMHRLGWNTAYLRMPLAAGLATESLSAHIGQRMRWARGMVQIFRIDNPLAGQGPDVFQRSATSTRCCTSCSACRAWCS